MASPAPQTTAATKPTIRVPSGPEIYDRIMGQIEPELLSRNLPLLKEKYKGETPEQKAEREQRYAAAYAAFDAAFSKWVIDVNAAVAAYRRSVLRDAEEKSQSKEVNELSQLESSIKAA